MSKLGVDYSWARPGGAAIRDAGFEFAMRYVDYPGAAGKGLTVEEANDLHAHGIDIGLVFESTAERPLQGYQAGVSDANTALYGARQVGFPENRPIYFAVDFDAREFQYPVIRDYFDGVLSILDILRVGVYGGFYVVEHIHQTGRAAWIWQALAWSYGNLYDYRHLYQYLNGQTINGGEVDYNEAYGDDQGLWSMKEDEMPDPRVDKIMQALSGKTDMAAAEADVDAWNANGNDLFGGYAKEQADQDKLEEAIESINDATDLEE